ncbi:MAG: glycosyltransferase [Nitrospirota bacterium]|nr:glycosyltransferase [Nitrospirota bacterium]MDH4361385.1 glycosyltransferase [Nitrospirota bacterium]
MMTAHSSGLAPLPDPLNKTGDELQDGKHLAIFLPSLAGGGVARAMLYLSEAFADRNHRVDLILCQVSGPYLDSVSPKVKVIGLKGRAKWLGRLHALSADFGSLWSMLLPILLSSRPPKTIGYLPDLVDYLRREKPDTMFTAKTPANLTALWAGRLSGGTTRIVINEQTSLSPILKTSKKWRWRFLAPLLRHVYPWADEILTVSDGVAEDLSLLTGIHRDRITTIYNPVAINQVQEKAGIQVDHPWFTPDALPVILGVGRLVPQKDFICLIKAFERVRAVRPARLVILGEGRIRNELEELSKALGLTQDISMPGFVENPFAFMARSSVFVLSSAWEGCPNVLIEALACGCPVVSTDCPSGPSEILKKGSFGPLVPVGDNKAMAEAILKVLDHPLDQEQLRARASEFEVGRISEKYLQLLLPTKRPSNSSN